MKRLWLVRLGKNGEQESHALDNSELVLGFTPIDLRPTKDRDAILALLTTAYPDDKPKTLLNTAAQLNQFCNTMQLGDRVVVPLKTRSQIGIAEVSGPYVPTHDGRISRPIKWLKPDLQRDVFQQDLLYSFGAFMTVCEISRNDALRRVEAVVTTGKDPGFEAVIRPPNTKVAVTADPTAETAPIELAQIARDQIEGRIISKFAGHNFARLVAAILTAQGYVVNVSPPGADQGIDIVAGQGRLGLDAPRIAVQVKSGNTPVDQPTLQALIGSVHDTQANHGLLVSWGGFTRAVENRRNELYFRVRLWGRREIIDALLTVYDSLSEEIRADLPLQRIWTLVLNE